ncbi:MAG: transglutaminase family protein [Candidatus Latescibacteria bacterium]|nr:transglutaminase family protein [Candidatus Latescibacterota bacterium]
MFFEIVHTTRFVYSRPVFLEPHTVRLRPRCDCAQRLVHFTVGVDPLPAGRSECIDLDGNTSTRLWFDGLHESTTLTATSGVETLCARPFDYFLEPAALELPMTYSGAQAALLEPYRTPSGSEREVADFAGAVAREAGGRTNPFLAALNGRIYETCEKIIREEGDPLPPAVTLARRQGACRDLTMLFMEACRSVGIAARFVSGYEAGDPETQERYLHAWAEVYLPGAGWRGYDPMHGLGVADRHVALATGPTPDQAQPISGTFRGTGATSSMAATLSIRVR